MSPPCVAHFEGDNGGATHQGVTGDQVKILFYVQGGYFRESDNGYEPDPGPDNDGSGGSYHDLGEPPGVYETVLHRNLRRFQAHFNQRYQTYGRSVRFIVFINEGQVPSGELMRSHAADNFKRVEPFAVFTSLMAPVGGIDAYTDEMARRGVMTFGSIGTQRDEAFYRRYPGLRWDYNPTIETSAKLFSDMVCSSIVGKPVVDSANPGENGGPRKLGLITTTDDTQPHLVRLGELVEERVEACGGEFAEKVTHPVSGWVHQTRQPQFREDGDATASYAPGNMATFQSAGVTTIVWAGGYETDQSKAADRIGYRPEWVLGGDEIHAGNTNAREQDQDAWDHAWITTTATRVPPVEDDPCRRSLREADPSIGARDTNSSTGCGSVVYRDLRQFFTGVQVAGPRLNPASMDQGFHAIPSIASADPTLPACFYLPGDYTCVKDATLEWWDRQGTPAHGGTGCWRMVAGGQRFLAGQWPDEALDQRAGPDDPCNAFQSAAQYL